MEEHKLTEYFAVKQEMARLSKLEREMRAKICEEYLMGVLEGSRTVNAGRFKVTVSAVLNRSVDAEALDTIWEDLNWDEQQLIEFKPKLKIKEYKQAEAVGTKLMDVVTVKPGMSQLKVEELYNE